MANTRTGAGARASAKAPKPDRRKTFNLDTLEKDAKAPKPMPIVHGGNEYILYDIDEVDRDELKQLSDDPDEMLAAMLGEEQHAEFRQTSMPGWKWRAMWDQIDDHFGYKSRMGDEGEDDASPTS